MQRLLKERDCTDKGFIVACVIVDDAIVGWTITDRQLQRVTRETFKTAHIAFEWAERNYKELQA